MQVAATFVKSGLPAINYQCALPRFAKAGLEAAHGEGTGAGGVAEAGEVEDAVEDVGEEFIAEAEAVAFAEGGGDLGADHDLAVRERRGRRQEWGRPDGGRGGGRSRGRRPE